MRDIVKGGKESMILEDLKDSISSLSDEELQKTLMDIRRARKDNVAKKRSASSSPKKKKEISINIDGISKDDAIAMLRQLLGEG